MTVTCDRAQATVPRLTASACTLLTLTVGFVGIVLVVEPSAMTCLLVVSVQVGQQLVCSMAPMWTLGVPLVAKQVLKWQMFALDPATCWVSLNWLQLNSDVF